MRDLVRDSISELCIKLGCW